MYTNFKKLLPIACAACACLTVSADSNGYGSNSGNDKGRMQNSNGLNPNYTGLASSGAKVEGGADFMFGLTGFVWTCGAAEGSFAQTGGIERIKDAAGGMTNVERGTTHFFDSDWDGGFKVMAGAVTSLDGDHVYLEYTWFHSNHTASAAKANRTYPGDNFVSLGAPVDIIDGFPLIIGYDSVASEYWVQYNDFNFMFGRGSYVSAYMTADFEIGLKGGWGNNRVKDTTKGTVLIDWEQNEGRDLTCYDNFRVSNKDSMWWIGLRALIAPAFYFNKNWSMLGKLAISTVWNDSTMKYKEKLDVCNNSQDGSGAKTSKTVVNTKGSAGGVGTVIETEAGFRYEWWSSDDDLYVAAAATYQFSDWMNAGPFGYTTGANFSLMVGF